MSRLDSFIRRVEAQRACLDMAAALVRGLDGSVLELGLGNGRTYDHLRELCPDREIFVCERHVAAHPGCIPPPELLLLGDMRETLPAARGRLEGQVALAHLDPGTGDVETSRALALRTGADGRAAAASLAASWSANRRLPCRNSRALALPEAVIPGRYHVYRRVSPLRS